jgi:RNA polymerase primary sigma factor
MPPLRRLRIGALDDLARQLRFAPAETLRRQLERAEQLAAEIDPAVNYPEDWVIFRVTGYRPQIEAPAIVVGEALIGDMSALVERLSAAAKIGEAELDENRFVDSSALQERWGVSRKTLERYRSRGLIARRVLAKRGVSRLAFLRESVERFETAWKTRIDDAANFTRISSHAEARMLRRANAYRQLGCSLNQAAARIARRYDRSHETVRQLIRRRAVDFGESGPPTAQERRLIERAWWWGLEPGRIARHLNRPSASVLRVAIDSRAARLKTLDIAPDAALRPLHVESALASNECAPVLGTPGATDLLEWTHVAREVEPPDVATEKQRVIAYHGLIARAVQGIAALKNHGNAAGAVDQIETHLRWAARIKAELIRSQMALIVRTLEASMARPLEEIRSTVLIALVTQSMAAAAEAADTFHAGKGGRLAAPIGLAVTRVGAKFARDASIEPAARARARLALGVRIPDWTGSVAPWQSYRGNLWLEPHQSVRRGLGTLDPRARRLLELRYGWGGPPMTVIDAAKEIDLPPVRAAAMERRALGRAAKAGIA